MKHLSIRRLIPIAAAGALLSVGCGGKAVDEGNGDGDGDGDGPGPGPRPDPSDPLSGENFEASLNENIDIYCRRLVGCDGFDSQGECTDVISELFERAYDLESRNCRGLLLETFDCFNDSWRGCYDYTSACEDLEEELYEYCFFGGLYEYDY